MIERYCESEDSSIEFELQSLVLLNIEQLDRCSLLSISGPTISSISRSYSSSSTVPSPIETGHVLLDLFPLGMISELKRAQAATVSPYISSTARSASGEEVYALHPVSDTIFFAWHFFLIIFSSSRNVRGSMPSG